MKKNFILFFLMMALSIHAQFRMNDGHSNLSQPDFTMVEKNSNGRIKSVRYAATDPNIPATAVDFFNSTCIKCKTDSFALDRFQETDYGMRFERYQQYFQGVLVDDGYYIFRFKNGKMKVVKGNCVNTTNINPQPSLTESEAIDSYASYLGVRKCDIIQSYVDLMVKEIPDTHRKGTTVSLTYRVYLRTFNITDCFVGYIDAHTGELLLKEKAYYSSSATGQLYTYYNRNLNDQPKSGITEYTNNKYYLADNTRGNGIHTYKQNQSGSTEFFSNNDNIWTRDELGDYNIALDVHWTMEQIYDLMNSQFSRNSYDGSGRLVKSYIDPLATNSYYIPNYDDRFIFAVALGSSVYGPFGSVDVIGHEYGHAILCNTTNFQNGQIGDPKNAIHEGLADIWGIIFEKYITPSADYWKTAEQFMIDGSSCLRNFQNPDDLTAYTQIASTYGHGVFYSSDPHVVGGILPYWFYLLVNGGTGTNGYNNVYQLLPVGFELAVELFSKTTLTFAYLDGCTSFSDVMYAFIDAALDMNNDFLAEQVENTWYAVGLTVEPTHIHNMSYAPGSATYYVYGNSNCTVNWSISNLFGSSPILVPNSNDYSCTVYSNASFGCYLNATINCSGCTVTYSRYISGTSSPSSAGDDILRVIPLSENRYQISLSSRSDGKDKMVCIKVYDVKNLQTKIHDNFEKEDYIFETFSWKRGFYIIEITMGKKKYTTKLSVR